MSIPQKRKGFQTLSSRRDQGTPGKWHASGSHTSSGTFGASGSREKGATLSPDVTKFWPNAEFTSHVSEIDETRTRFMHATTADRSVDASRLMFNLILEASLENSSQAYLPFWLLVTDFLAQHFIVPEPHETHLSTSKPISRITLCLSNAHLGVTPLPLQLRPYAMDLDPSDDEAPPPPIAIDIPFTSIAPPPTAPVAALTIAFDSRIADTIAALFAHINVIHADLVERISLVHE
ncbi:hypothetical protein Acr_00g0068890 [Actinidia rufa]|uniref:Uncharacterized protein n=1 Tax=Actinidia rufa TaxID=165716 RepID=A0A7J0DQT3_9ERIC|nr:hypothetical protein Acr_00g0068890 [Actinidia rufa]